MPADLVEDLAGEIFELFYSSSSHSSFLFGRRRDNKRNGEWYNMYRIMKRTNMTHFSHYLDLLSVKKENQKHTIEHHANDSSDDDNKHLKHFPLLQIHHKSSIENNKMLYFYCKKSEWPYRLTVRTDPSQGLNSGSIPGRVTNVAGSAKYC